MSTYDTETSSTTLDNLIAPGVEINTAPVTVETSQTLTRGSAVGLKTLGTGTVTPYGSNTGDGTVTLLAGAGGSLVPAVGSYVLTCTETGGTGVAAGTVTPGSNTGNGTVTALAISTGTAPKVGTFNLTCTDANEGGTATGVMAYVGTGNGIAGTVTMGAEAIEGDYIITCIDATISGSEVFSVIDPNGVRLKDLTVGVAYSNSHFGVTISDGSTDFTAGGVWTLTCTIAHGGIFELVDPDGIVLDAGLTLPGSAGGTLAVDVGGIAFTITDGSADFAVGDTFAITVTATESGGGTFKLVDPAGSLVATGLKMTGGAGVATDFEVGGMTFRITDGATDFAVGDYFTLAFAAGNGRAVKLDKTALDGSQLIYGICLEDVTTVGSTDVATVAITGKFNTDTVNFASGTAYTDVQADARLKGILFADGSY